MNLDSFYRIVTALSNVPEEEYLFVNPQFYDFSKKIKQNIMFIIASLETGDITGDGGEKSKSLAVFKPLKRQ